MTPAEFADLHTPALEADEVRHNLILGMLARARDGRLPELRHWTLGEPGHCALQTSSRFGIILGGLDADECRRLAERTADIPWLGVVGADETAEWFAARATTLGIAFGRTIRQRIYALSVAPRFPGASGHARPVDAGDADLFADWMTAFHAEAVPHDPVPSREELAKTAAGGGYTFWIDGGRPVSMAGINRRSRSTATVAGVYTPPALRGRGYAGSVTAAVVARIFGEGRSTACLYAELNNPAAIHAYVRVGFAPWCDSMMILRQR
jgi:RimJ/RimL family protein N-acetyltransferase